MKIRLRYGEFETDEMSYQELYDLKTKVADSANDIESQIVEKRMVYASDRIRIDPEWFARANHALRKHKQYMQLLQETLSKRRKEERKADRESLNDCFVKICVRELPFELFQKLLESAKALFEEEKNGQRRTKMSDVERLKKILREHDAEVCPNCGHEIGFGDLAWNEARSEAGTPYTVIEIQCINCQTEIVQIMSWFPTADYPEELLNILETDWKRKAS